MKNIRVVLDGYELTTMQEVAIRQNTQTMGPFLSECTMYEYAAGKTRIALRTVDNTELAFDIYDKPLTGGELYETVIEGDTTVLYVYGPLKKLIPSLFVDKDLLPWQMAFLSYTNKPKYLQYKLHRDDVMFTYGDAQCFAAGYHAGERINAREKRKYQR